MFIVFVHTICRVCRRWGCVIWISQSRHRHTGPTKNLRFSKSNQGCDFDEEFAPEFREIYRSAVFFLSKRVAL
jgi:hypothetical protein